MFDISALNPSELAELERHAAARRSEIAQEHRAKTIAELTATASITNTRPNAFILDFLKALPSPLGIISVAGMYRTGKSYLLNRMLLNRSGGFGVGPTINPCTKVSLSI